MEIVNANISKENEEKLASLENQILKERLRQADEQIAKLNKREVERNELAEIVAEQRAEDRYQAKLAQEAAEKQALDAAAAADSRPYVPLRSGDYRDYLNLTVAQKSKYLDLYGSEHLDQLRREHSRRLQKEQELARIGLKDKK